MITKAMTHDTEAPTMTAASNAPPGWLTTDEVAAMARCSVSTVARAIRIGNISNVRQSSAGTWLINRDEGIQWAENYQPYEGLRRRE